SYTGADSGERAQAAARRLDQAIRKRIVNRVVGSKPTVDRSHHLRLAAEPSLLRKTDALYRDIRNAVAAAYDEIFPGLLPEPYPQSKMTVRVVKQGVRDAIYTGKGEAAPQRQSGYLQWRLQVGVEVGKHVPAVRQRRFIFPAHSQIQREPSCHFP